MNPSSFTPGMPAPRRARHGWVVQVLGVLALGVVLLLTSNAVFTPWSFYMGGHFHLFPQWSGWGRMHSNLAGDYILYVQLSPTSGGRGTYRAVPHIKG